VGAEAVTFSAEQEFELIGGKDNTLHSHAFDRTPTHSTLDGLQVLQNAKKITAATYTALVSDDFILVDSTAAPVTITLPYSNAGKELTVVRVAGANNVTIARVSASDTVNGGATVVIAASFVPVHLKAFKALSLGWVQV
jgi:hypothetical protein